MCLAVPGQVESITPPSEEQPLAMGRVDFGGLTREVCLAPVPDVAVGDWVLVHAGFAIQRLQPDDAAARRAWIGVEDP